MEKMEKEDQVGNDDFVFVRDDERSLLLIFYYFVSKEGQRAKTAKEKKGKKEKRKKRFFYITRFIHKHNTILHIIVLDYFFPLKFRTVHNATRLSFHCIHKLFPERLYPFLRPFLCPSLRS